MRLLQSMERTNNPKTSFEIQGLAGWMLDLLRRLQGGKTSQQQKQMRVVETLALGGRRQLMLVSCGEERFLVGGGMDSIETIVRVKAAGLDEGEICL
ncbi:MAG TPA: flagellar biosynthetic protein FliO [Edaphobacter sp.]|nr:flagellar biosynthetic protein FliO [Edaphobacter sp.]